MDLNLYPDKNIIKLEGYGSGFIKLSGKKIFSPIILFPKLYFLVKSSNYNIKRKILDYSKNDNIDLIIVGLPTGLSSYENKTFIQLKSLGYPIEVMNTDAACRTWTVLVGERRSVCAFLKPSNN